MEHVCNNSWHKIPTCYWKKKNPIELCWCEYNFSYDLNIDLYIHDICLWINSLTVDTISQKHCCIRHFPSNIYVDKI